MYPSRVKVSDWSDKKDVMERDVDQASALNGQKGFQWIYVAILIVMAFTGFGQMPIFKRYYISDIPRHGLVCRLLFDPLHSLSQGNSPFRPYRLGDSRFSLPWKKDKKAKSFRLRADTPSGGDRANRHPARHEEPTRRDFLSHVHPGYRHLSPRVRHGLHPGRAPVCNLPFDLDGVLGRGSMTAGLETKMFSSRKKEADGNRSASRATV